MLLLDGQVHHDTHAIPMGNYVIGVGNYVIATPSKLGNYMSADNPLARSVSQAPLRWLSILAAPGRPCRGRTPGTCVADDGWHMEPDQGLTNTDMLRDTTKVGSVRPSTFR